MTEMGTSPSSASMTLFLNGWCWWLLLTTFCSSWIPCVHSEASQLVLFAGPHRAASTSIESFFYRAAAGHASDDADRTITVGLKDWLWPHINSGVVISSNSTTIVNTEPLDDDNNNVEANDDDDDSVELPVNEEQVAALPYKIFGKLVTEPNDELLQQEILEGIRKAWNTNGINGVVLGTEWFDKVADEEVEEIETIITEEDDEQRWEEMSAWFKSQALFRRNGGLLAMKKIVDYLEIHPRDVTVVLNYRTPRIDQWISIWSAVEASLPDIDDADTVKNDDVVENGQQRYAEWLCNKDLKYDIIELLATQMNPLNAAEAFVREGWNVKLIDMGGVNEARREISHVIACDVLTGHCNDGQLFCHKTDHPSENELSGDIFELSTEAKLQAETLFQYRDCAFQETLESSQNFEILYKSSIWSECDVNSTDPTAKETYAKLKQHSSALYMALLSQVECPSGKSPVDKARMITMEDALSGNIPNYTLSTLFPVNKIKKVTTATSSSNYFLELVLFTSILIGSFAAHYYRMKNSIQNSEPGWMQVPVSDEEADLREIQETDGLDAEYGDVGHEDDDDDDPPIGHSA